MNAKRERLETENESRLEQRLRLGRRRLGEPEGERLHLKPPKQVGKSSLPLVAPVDPSISHTKPPSSRVSPLPLVVPEDPTFPVSQQLETRLETGLEGRLKRRLGEREESPSKEVGKQTR